MGHRGHRAHLDAVTAGDKRDFCIKNSVATGPGQDCPLCCTAGTPRVLGALWVLQALEIQLPQSPADVPWKGPSLRAALFPGGWAGSGF